MHRIGASGHAWDPFNAQVVAPGTPKVLPKQPGTAVDKGVFRPLQGLAMASNLRFLGPYSAGNHRKSSPEGRDRFP